MEFSEKSDFLRKKVKNAKKMKKIFIFLLFLRKRCEIHTKEPIGASIMATKKTKEESMTSFFSHKVKNDADFCRFMRPRNSDHDINSLEFSGARLKHNKVV